MSARLRIGSVYHADASGPSLVGAVARFITLALRHEQIFRRRDAQVERPIRLRGSPLRPFWRELSQDSFRHEIHVPTVPGLEFAADQGFVTEPGDFVRICNWVHVHAV